MTLGDGDLPKAVETLQLAISACPSPMPATVVDVIATVAETLVAMDEVPAAFGHLLLLASLLPEDQHTLSLLMRINQSPQVPLLFKEEPDFLPLPRRSQLESQVRRGA